MEVKFKRSFLGYSPRTVEKAINAIHGSFEQQLKGLEEEYTQGESEIQSLKGEMNELKKSLTTFQAMEEELSKMLVTAHLTACKKVMDALHLSAQMEEEAIHKVRECEKESFKLKNTKDEIIKEIQSMTIRYSRALEGTDHE